MPSGGSVTHWIREVREGDSRAAAALWDRYFPQLVRLAKKKLRGLPGQMADEEDVALSAMNRFYQAAEEGRYPELADRDGLWRLLFQITMHRVIDLRRRESRQQRGGDRGRSARRISDPRASRTVVRFPGARRYAITGNGSRHGRRMSAAFHRAPGWRIAGNRRRQDGRSEQRGDCRTVEMLSADRRTPPAADRDKWKRVWSKEQAERS